MRVAYCLNVHRCSGSAHGSSLIAWVLCRIVALVRDVSGVEAVRRTNDRKRKEEDKVGRTSRRKETLVKTGGLVWKVGGTKTLN